MDPQICVSCPFRVPSSQALLSCSEHARFCCPFWLLSSSQSTVAPTCGPAATRSTTMAHRATYTARRADPARARSLYWRTAVYNPTDEGGGHGPQTPSQSPPQPAQAWAVHLFTEDDITALSCSPPARRQNELWELAHILQVRNWANWELTLALRNRKWSKGHFGWREMQADSCVLIWTWWRFSSFLLLHIFCVFFFPLFQSFNCINVPRPKTW